MTIIAFDPENNKVRVDRRHTFDTANGRRPYAASKVQSSDRGSKLAFSGPCIPVAMIAPVALKLLDSIAGPSARGQISGFAADVECYGFGRSANNGKVYILMYAHEWLDIVEANHHCNNDFAEGCGAEWYNAYRALGMSVHDAFQRVCEYHQGCGDGYDEF